MKQQCIYEIVCSQSAILKNIINKEPVYSYFSNLKKCIETLNNTLALQGWPIQINYTAVYRAMQAKGLYHSEYKLQGQRMFKISIVKKTINPSISLLGIEPNPTMDRQEF